MVEKKRTIIIHHPTFDGENGIDEAKQYASVLAEGLRATRDQENPKLSRDQQEAFKDYLSQYKFYIRKLDEDIL